MRITHSVANARRSGTLIMTPTIIEHHGARRAYILQQDDDETTTRLATVYKMSDGWHAKLSDDHSRRAWSGPYESPEDALTQLSA
jgi:hypothetical protein